MEDFMEDIEKTLQNQTKWYELADNYYFKKYCNEQDVSKQNEYYKKYKQCIENSRKNLPFDQTQFPDLIPFDWEDNKTLPNPTKHNDPTNNKGNDRNSDFRENPYDFNYKKTTETEKLEEYIKAGLPVFIHGPSGCGKSARVKAIDPDCTIIYLATAKPDTLAGKQVNMNGELKNIPPEWYEQLCKKCKEQPDKIHILFLDECTNATPTIQGYAFNLVLDKELDGKWKLPDNVRVVAAGNEVSESLSANKMSEPLFRRFAHIYIKTTVKDWLLWASKSKIHPAIYAFVASHGLDDEKNPVLRTKYDGENCTDPRRWEKASNQMKFTNNPYNLTGIIGKELTEEFVKFTQKKVITLYDVLNDNYNLEMPKIPADIAYNTLVGLASVDEENVKKVRDFVKKYMIAEQYKNFVQMWTLGDTKRIEMLKEFDLLEEEEKKEEIKVTFKGSGK